MLLQLKVLICNPLCVISTAQIYLNLMNTSLKKAASAAKDEHIIIFTTNSANFNQQFFSKPELNFIKSEIKKKSKLIAINQYNRFIFLQIVDTGSKESF